MPRRPRIATGGYVFHVLNRGVARLNIFADDDDFAAFERVLAEAQQREPRVQLLGYCLMSNHWHLVLRPRTDDSLSELMRWLTVTHTQRWHAHHGTSGTGPVYQGRFKSFPVQTDESLVTVLRYVERNALRAGLVKRAEDWRWGSLWRWMHRHRKLSERGDALPHLDAWPIERPRRWRQLVNRPLSQAELEAVRGSLQRGRPLGSDRWTRATAARLSLSASLSPIGRPRRGP